MDNSFGEFNLFRKRTIEHVFDETAISSFGMELSKTDLKSC